MELRCREALKEINPKLDKTLIKRLNLELRDYQEDAVNKCMQLGRGVVLLGTGAGKTLTIATLIDNFYLYSTNYQPLAFYNSIFRILIKNLMIPTT